LLTLEDIDDAVDRMNLTYPLMGFFHPADGVVEITAMDRDQCGGCGQTISVQHPRPNKWIDRTTGQIIGSHDHQHGCGTWNAPCSVLIKIDMQQPIDQQLESGAAEVKKIVAESVGKQNDDIRKKLTALLSSARNEIRRIENDHNLTPKQREQEILAQLTGESIEPGIARTNPTEKLETPVGRILAWEWEADPLRSIHSQWATIEVAEPQTSNNQCQAVTRQGTRCTRLMNGRENYCHQHQKKKLPETPRAGIYYVGGISK